MFYETILQYTECQKIIWSSTNLDFIGQQIRICPFGEQNSVSIHWHLVARNMFVRGEQTEFRANKDKATVLYLFFTVIVL